MAWLVAFLSDRADKVAERVRRWGHETTHENLYPGYLFFSYSHDWQNVLSVEGIARVFGFWTDDNTFRPNAFSDDDIARFAAVDTKPGPGAPFRAGELVEITSGAETGCVGVYHEQASKGERSVIELDFLGYRRRITIATHRLASASARRPLLARSA